jgi:hypothetical protein
VSVRWGALMRMSAAVNETTAMIGSGVSKMFIDVLL